MTRHTAKHTLNVALAVMVVLGASLFWSGAAAALPSATTISSSVGGLSSEDPYDEAATISWDKVSTATRYRVYWSTSSSMPGRCEPTCHIVTPDDLDDPSQTLTQIIKSTPKVGQKYYIKVSALNSAGKTITGWQTTPFTIVPSVRGLATEDQSSSTATISWDKVSAATRYRVYWSTKRSMASSCEPTCHIVTPDDLNDPSQTLAQIIKSTPKVGQEYNIKVSALNSAGKTISGWQTTALPVALVAAPTIPEAVEDLATSGVSTTDATVFWKPVPTATKYRVYWSTSPTMPGRCEPQCKIITPTSATNPVQSLSQIMSPTEPTAGGQYYVKVSALNSAGKTITGWQTTPLKITLIDPDSNTIPASVQGLNATDVTATNATIGWNAVPTAAKYRVYWSTSPTMAGRCEPNCKIITPSSSATPSQTLAQIMSPTAPTAGSTYYVKVSALNSAGKTITGWQANPLMVVLPGAVNAVPTGLGLVGASATSLSLDWNDVLDAPQYRIQLSTSANMADSVYYRFTESEGMIDDLARSTTYYAKVRVISTSGDNLGDYSDAVQVKTLAVDSVPLDVAAFNVKCQSCYPAHASDRGPGELPWVDRRQTVVSTILSRKPDVIGIQEASQAWLIENGKQIDLSQFEDLRNRLKTAGGTYELTNAHRNNCVKSTTPTNCVVKDQGASKGTKILYNTQKLTMVRQGSNGLKRASSSGQERFVAWAEFTQKSSGQRFLFATTHLEPGSQFYELRKTQAAQIVSALEAANPGGLPVVLVGDMNSTQYATPANAPYDVYIASGLIDPLGMTFKSPKVSSKATAEKRIHANYNSYSGFDPQIRRYATDENGSNLDYILTTPMQVKEWETVVALNSSGDLTGIIPSDHNMLAATLVLPH